MSDIVSNNPKASVTALATGLESLSALIKDVILQRICIILSPGVALALLFIYRNLKRSINNKRGLSEYKLMIAEYEAELNSPMTTDERKKFIKDEIQKCWINMNKIRTENIKIITE